MNKLFIFFCSENTYLSCIQMNLFGSNNRWPLMVRTGDLCCLYHYSIKTLFALWRADSDGGSNINKAAWHGKFPFQAKVKLISSEVREIPPPVIGEVEIKEGMIELENGKDLSNYLLDLSKITDERH